MRRMPSLKKVTNCIRSLTDLVILGILNAQPTHAYRMKQIAFEKFGIKLYPGVLYPKLRRLEKDSVIEGKWKKNLRKKKVYSPTAYGKKLYDQSIKNYLLIIKKLEEMK